jgi:hypothetical protein
VQKNSADELEGCVLALLSHRAFVQPPKEHGTREKLDHRIGAEAD